MKKIFLLIAITSFFTTSVYAYSGQGYKVLAEQLEKSPGIINFALKQSSLPYKQARQEEISIDAKAYSISVGVGKKIPARADFKIDINNYSSIVKHYTVIAKVTVCDRDYSLLKRTYEVDAGYQVHENPSFNIDVAPFESPRTCIIKARIESLGKEDNISKIKISYATLQVHN